MQNTRFETRFAYSYKTSCKLHIVDAVDSIFLTFRKVQRKILSPCRIIVWDDVSFNLWNRERARVIKLKL